MSNEKKQTKLFPEPSPGSAVLTDTEISDAVARGMLIARDTYDPTSLEPCSYDVRVGLKGILGGQGEEIDLQSRALELGPGAYAGILSLERLVLPSDTFARIGSKRFFSYEGVILLTGAIVDPGYEGHLLFGLYNASQKKVIVRTRRKICNITFERLPHATDKIAASDPDLRTGNFPDDFVNKMANMEVLPWMQISERVKQIEQITQDILDLKARYEDVLEPIRKLTENVNALTQDVASLTQETRSIAKDVSNLEKIVAENSKQVTQITVNLGTIVGQLGAIQERSRALEETDRTQQDLLTSLRTRFGRFQLLIYIFWALLLLVAGALLPELFKRLFRTG